VDRKEAEARELADLAKRRAADKAAWERSKEKGDLGYYQSHQKSGGYKDGLSQEDFKMGKPQKLSEEAQNKIDAIKRSAAKNPPKDSKLPANPGTKVLKYSWEDAKDSAKIYIDEVPGYDTWAEADIPKQNCSVYWDDRESLILLLTNTAGDKSWYLHIPRLFRDVNDINTIWKKKRLTIKIMKRKDEDWDSLDFKPVLPKTDEDAEREFYEDRNPDKPKTKFMDKSRMPFGDDMGDYVDKMGDIDIDSKAGPMGGLAGMFGF
jgi:hypothetical protein